MAKNSETVQAAPIEGSRPLSVGWQVGGLLVWLVVCFGASAIGSAATISEISGWYAGLEKPSFNPPNWIFGPVWSVLFFLMATAAWLVWRRYGFAGAMTALFVFLVQLVANVVWSVLFFGLHSPAMGLGWIFLLWLLIATTIGLFWTKSRWAAGLLVPYLAWVSFASVLNFMIWRLN